MPSMPLLVEVPVNSSTMRWYRSKGYEIPTRRVQLYLTRNGKRTKHGTEERVARGTKIFVRPEDVQPSSNIDIPFICATCGKECKTQWKAYLKKRSDNCVSCQAKKGFRGGCHDYWVQKLITNNEDAHCDISGERDKRFLILHHKLSRSLGGKSEEANYVILSANYHLAFHVWVGGMNLPCRPEDYERFKSLELKRLKERPFQ